MGTVKIYDEPDRARKEARIARRVTRNMPADVKAYYVKQYHGVAEDAFKRLLTGSDHECFKCHCHTPSHQAVRMFLEMAGAVGASQMVIVNVLQKIGVKDEAELNTLVESGRRLERLGADMSHQGLFDDALEALRLCLNAHPEWKGKALARLGSVESANGGEP